MAMFWFLFPLILLYTLIYGPIPYSRQASERITHSLYNFFKKSFTCLDKCKVVNAINKYNDVFLLPIASCWCHILHKRKGWNLNFYTLCFLPRAWAPVKKFKCFFHYEMIFLKKDLSWNFPHFIFRMRKLII